MRRWQAVVFDLDDTLYPEREYVLGGFAAVARWLADSRGLSADDVYRELSGMFAAGVRGDTFDRCARQCGLPASVVPEMVEVYRGHTPRLHPFPGIPGLLDALAGRVKLGLVSDGYLEVQRKKFHALGFAPYFDAVVFSDELGRASWKPSPAPFRRVLEGLGVPAESAVYVADNCAKDFIGARQAGLATLWSRHSGGDYACVEPPSPAHVADRVVHSVEELHAVLGDALLAA